VSPFPILDEATAERTQRGRRRGVVAALVAGLLVSLLPNVAYAHHDWQDPTPPEPTPTPRIRVTPDGFGEPGTPNQTRGSPLYVAYQADVEGKGFPFPNSVEIFICQVYWDAAQGKWVGETDLLNKC